MDEYAVWTITNTFSRAEVFWNLDGDYFFTGDVVYRHRRYNSQEMRNFDRFCAVVHRHLAMKAGAVFAAVAADVADDVPRLALADWLQEHGVPEWANTIRVMCAVPHEFDAEVQTERMGHGRPPPAVATVAGWLEDHAPHHLSVLLGGRRCEPVPGDWVCRTWCPGFGLRAEWRGFIAQVRGPFSVVRQHLLRILSGHPVERAVASDRRARDVAAFYPNGHGPGESQLPWALYERLRVIVARLETVTKALSDALIAEANANAIAVF